MKTPILALALLSLAACGKADAPASTGNVEDVAANDMSNDEVTEVLDDSSAQSNMVDDAVGGGSGNNMTVVDPD